MTVALAALLLGAACSSSTLIQSVPSGARLYLDGEAVGTTPYQHRDTRITGSTVHVRLEMQGYSPLDRTFCRDEEIDPGAVVGGVFFLWPFLWTMKYKPVHTYELTPLAPVAPAAAPASLPDLSQADRARLEALLSELQGLMEKYAPQAAPAVTK
ncbi:MAG: PEGA domain-containing protein [Bacteroidia bacterium]|nr:PEGA domain-containing protein [Bacteroidia bacterium]